MNLASTERNETLLVLQNVETSVLGYEVFSVFLRGTQVCSGHAGLNKAYPSEMIGVWVALLLPDPCMISTASCSATNVQIGKPDHV